MKKINGLWLIAFFLILAAPMTASDPDDRAARIPHKIPKVNEKVKIDGVLDEKVWQDALVLTLDYEVEPGENIAPPAETELLLAYDTKYLYAGFRAYDPEPTKIRARVTDRDNIQNDDYVGIVLDTFNDSRRAYQFSSNPYGIQTDQIISMTGGGAQWDGIWNSSGKINEKGYIVEMAIPFSTLRFQGEKEDQVWRLDAVRSYPRNLSHMIGLFPRDRSNNCYMCQADQVIGFKGARTGLNLEFDPTLSTILTQEREDFLQGDFIKKTDDLEPGLTARWSFTPNLTLNAALNPDFSQVEADVAQLDINTQFALFYPEKRPFFLEGATIFFSRFYAIHTRTIVNPEWGLKLTGKEGKHAIGLFSARDTVTNLIFPSSQSSQSTSLDMKNISTALRYRRDVGKSSHLGIVITDREGEDYFNRLAGIDGDLRFTKKDRIFFQFVGSQSRYPDDTVSKFNQPQGRFSGGAFDALYEHSTRHVYLYTHYQDVTPNFRSDVGFTDQTGTRLYEGGGTYIWRQNPGHWYTILTAASEYVYMTDHHNQLLKRSFRSWITYEGPLQSFFAVQANFGKRVFSGKEFNDNNLNFNLQVRPVGSLFLGVFGIFGDQVDFSNVRAGKRVNLNPALQYNIGRHIYLGLDHEFERLSIDGEKLYTANLSNIRLVYYFSRRAFLRAILQYADYEYNTALYTQPRDPEFKHLFSQVLFSYKINPQTVLFLGYSDDYYGDGVIPLTQNNRTFFLKIGYALVL